MVGFIPSLLTLKPMFFPLCRHCCMQHHRATNLWKLTLCFIDLTCDFMAGVLFFLSVFLFAVKCSVLWQRTHPALGSPHQCQLCVSSSRQKQMLPINLARCPSSESEVTPTLPLSCSSFSLLRNIGNSFCRYQAAWLSGNPPGPVIS